MVTLQGKQINRPKKFAAIVSSLNPFFFLKVLALKFCF